MSMSSWIFNISEIGYSITISGQPVPVLGHPHSEKVFPDVQREPPVFQSVPIAPGPVTGHHWKEPGCLLYTLPLWTWMRSLLGQFFSMLNSPSLLSLSLHERCPNPVIIFVALSWPCSFQTAVFFKAVCTNNSQSHSIKLTIRGVRQIINICFFRNQMLSSLIFNEWIDFGYH